MISAGPPVQFQGCLKRTCAFGSTGPCRVACSQLSPPSTLTSTFVMRPRPLQASPLISCQPGSIFQSSHDCVGYSAWNPTCLDRASQRGVRFIENESVKQSAVVFDNGGSRNRNAEFRHEFSGWTFDRATADDGRNGNRGCSGAFDGLPHSRYREYRVNAQVRIGGTKHQRGGFCQGVMQPRRGSSDIGASVPNLGDYRFGSSANEVPLHGQFAFIR